MQARLFTFFDIPFPSYFTLLITGFIFATVMGAIWAKRVGQDPDVIVDLGLAMLNIHFCLHAAFAFTIDLEMN